MCALKKSLIAQTDAKANKEQIYVDGRLRITLLSPRLIRVEYGDRFTDLPSYAVWRRNFSAGKMQVKKAANTYTVETSDVIFTIKNGKPRSVYFKDTKEAQKFSNQKNLKGTYRTLDGTFGKIPLQDGLITKSGAYLYDDSKSMLIDNGGHFISRPDKTKDYYAFAYGKKYRETIQAFYQISSPVPLIPRFALGVWWSRYHAYTQQEYLDLMAQFRKENIPLTVATVDMDWHWVDIKKQFGINYSGWTGYSWNTELFPDYKAFLKELKENNLHVTLNLHPADGIHTYEDMHADFAKAMGVSEKKDIPFVCGNDDFWNHYFDILHKPYEKDGVDFWWIDWQQGKKSDVKGLDPLCALNHYHFLDNAENGELPLILSRYGGYGSHRYPLGFSGDTAINWRVLHFQPYFTANAANCAYTWWSHDIGGHHMGYRDDELYLRWIEFGVFSPILRLHSTALDFLGKEPWKYRKDVCESAENWLRFRHRLIPYLYTMDYRNHKEGVALCEPMYYSYPDKDAAFGVPNQYMFGSELMVCPITSKASKKTNFGAVKAWIPEGKYTDIFTLQCYQGPQFIELNREIYSIPVLAKEGAIIPLSNDSGNRCSNPAELEIWVFKGNNTFTLYEDNGKVSYEEYNVKTAFEVKSDKKTLTFTIKSPQGETSLIPGKRKYKIVFKDVFSEDIDAPEDAQIYYDKAGGVTVECPFSDKDTEINLKNIRPLVKESYQDKIINIFSRWQCSTARKNTAYKPFKGKTKKDEIYAALKKSRLPKSVKSLINEMLNQV